MLVLGVLISFWPCAMWPCSIVITFFVIGSVISGKFFIACEDVPVSGWNKSSYGSSSMFVSVQGSSVGCRIIWSIKSDVFLDENDDDCIVIVNLADGIVL